MMQPARVPEVRSTFSLA